MSYPELQLILHMRIIINKLPDHSWFANKLSMKVPFLPKQNDQDIVILEESSSEESLRAIIRGMNLKVTQQRILILKTMSLGHRHITAQELFEKIVKIDNSLGFATVYRFLKSLVEASVVTEVRMGGLPARYELAPKHHHDHLTCVKCGKICEFENKSIENLQLRVAEKFGFTLTHHVLELYGVCEDCQNVAKRVALRNGESKKTN
jgi:Fur family ferric uptake transcriptional regulator